MRIAAGVISVMVSALVLVGVTSCTPAEPPVLPVPEPTTTPLFASEEEALAAAEEAFTAYLAVVDSIYAHGGSEPERLTEVATAEVAEHERAGFEALAERGDRGVGTTLFDSLTIQQFDAEGSGPDVLLVYLCEDYSETDILAADGSSAVQQGRQLRWPLVVGFGMVREEFLVTSVESWAGSDFCVL